MASSSRNQVFVQSTCLLTSSQNTKLDLNALEKSATTVSGIDTGVPLWRRCIIVFVLSWITLSATFSSTSLLSVATEISNDLHTTPGIVNLSTGGLLLAMGMSSFIWSPLTSVSPGLAFDIFGD
jgi:hypothetical protein